MWNVGTLWVAQYILAAALPPASISRGFLPHTSFTTTMFSDSTNGRLPNMGLAAATDVYLSAR